MQKKIAQPTDGLQNNKVKSSQKAKEPNNEIEKCLTHIWTGPAETCLTAYIYKKSLILSKKTPRWPRIFTGLDKYTTYLMFYRW